MDSAVIQHIRHSSPATLRTRRVCCFRPMHKSAFRELPMQMSFTRYAGSMQPALPENKLVLSTCLRAKPLK
jgi:hypothetical protein